SSDLMSEGIVGRAISLSLDDDFKVLRENTIEYLDKLFRVRPVELLKHTSLFMDHREHIQTILDILVIFMRDVLIYIETDDSDMIMNRDKITIIEKYSGIIKRSEIRHIIDKIEGARKMLGDNVNYQLTIENMLLSISGGVEVATGSRNTI